MPRNGSGAYSLPEAPFVTGTTISSNAVNSDFSDIATALTDSIASDGQTPITGALKFPSGSELVPSITFTTDNTDGIYHPASGKLTVTLQGNDAFTVNQGSTVQIQPVSATNGGGILNNSLVLCPIGILQDFAGSTAPAGWLLCFGQAVSRTTYAALFTVLGTTFGAGDGSTTFNLPDCRGRVSVGKDNMGGTAANRITAGGCGITGTTLGANGGEQTHTLTTAEIPANIPNSATSTTTTTADGTYKVGGSTFNAGFSGSGINFPINPVTPTYSSSTSTTVTINAAGGGAHNNVQPTIIFNKIIFAGA